MAAIVSVSPEKVATPWLAVAVSVPPSVVPAGSAGQLPPSQRIGCCRSSPRCRTDPRSTLAGRKPLPAVTLAGGCSVIPTCEAAAGVTVMALVTPQPNPPPEVQSEQ